MGPVFGNESIVLFSKSTLSSEDCGVSDARHKPPVGLRLVMLPVAARLA
jgi:hypothetical protein